MYEYYRVIRILSSMYAFVAARGIFESSLSLSLFVCVIFSSKILPFFLRDENLHKNTNHISHTRRTMAEASDRGGFSRGFGRGGDRGDRRGRGGDRGGRGRGGRGRGRGKEDKDVWTPCTKLGRLVQAVRVRNYSLFLSSGGDVRSRNGRVSFEKVFRDVATAFATRSRGRDAFVARDFRSSLFCFPHRLWSHGRAFLGLDISLDMSLRARPRERYVLTNVPSFRRGIHTG